MLNRRDFLKGSAFGLAGITGAVALAGCSASPKPTQDSATNAVDAAAEESAKPQASAASTASADNTEAREVSLC